VPRGRKRYDPTQLAAKNWNVRSRRQRSLGWTAKPGPVAGPSESLMATRTGGFSRGGTSWMMASGTGLAPGGGVDMIVPPDGITNVDENQISYPSANTVPPVTASGSAMPGHRCLGGSAHRLSAGGFSGERCVRRATVDGGCRCRGRIEPAGDEIDTAYVDAWSQELDLAAEWQMVLDRLHGPK
jgi:hypothetical protein